MHSGHILPIPAQNQRDALRQEFKINPLVKTMDARALLAFFVVAILLAPLSTMAAVSIWLKSIGIDSILGSQEAFIALLSTATVGLLSLSILGLGWLGRGVIRFRLRTISNLPEALEQETRVRVQEVLKGDRANE